MVLVLELTSEALELCFQLFGEFCHGWLTVKVLLFTRVSFEIEQFPSVDFPVMDEFVGGGAYAVMGSGVVMSRIVVVPVVHGCAPVAWRISGEYGFQ